jgi:hypothetical protein
MSGKTLQERFWAKVEKTDTCWLWTGNHDRRGYGRIAVDGKTLGAHRVSYELMHGPIPPRMLVDHRCFNHACVNPSHLRLATQKQNVEHRPGANKNNLSSGVRGVTWVKREGKWQAMVVHNRKSHFAGYHLTIAAAEAAVIAKRLELFTHNDIDKISAVRRPSDLEQ